MRAAIYTRVSSQLQAGEDKVSLEVQEGEIRDYCAKNGHEVVETYTDVQSGADSRQERKQFERMLSDATKGKFNLILAWKPDRLFRSMWPAARLKRVMDLHNIAIECVRQPLDKKTLSIWAALAEMEVDNFKERSIMGRRRNAEKGKIKAPPWTKYGYDYDPKTQKLVVNNAEAEVVRRIFYLYIRGIGARKIALMLNNEHIPTKLQSLSKKVEHSQKPGAAPTRLEVAGKKCKGWQVATVLKVLDSHEYCGEGYACRYFNTPDNKKRKRAREEWIPVVYPILVDEAQFLKAQEQRKRNNRIRGPRKNEVQFLLDGLLYCRECGHLFNTQACYPSKKLADGTTVHYYQKPLKRRYICGGMKRYPHIYQCRSKPKSVCASHIEDNVWNAIVKCMHNPQFIQAEANCAQEMTSSNIAVIDSEFEKAKKRLQNAQLEEQAILTQFRKGKFDESALDLQLKAIREEKELWQEEIAHYSSLRSQALTNTSISQKVNDLRRSIDEVGNRSLSEKRELLHTLVDKIWLDREGNIIIEVALKELEPVAPVGASGSTPSSWY